MRARRPGSLGSVAGGFVHYVESLIGAIPPYAVYVLVFLVIGLESMGIPLPGEVVLVSSSLLAAHGTISPWGVAIAASAGAILGDSIGYALGRYGGRALFERLARRSPRHFGPEQIARAERAFDRWGVWTVFFGRFVALLRILAGPIAGSLRMPYWRFLLANMGGGIVWAWGTTFVIYFLGRAAHHWLANASWAMLALIILAGLTSLYLVRRSTRRAAAPAPEDSTRDDATQVAESDPADPSSQTCPRDPDQRVGSELAPSSRT